MLWADKCPQLFPKIFILCLFSPLYFYQRIKSVTFLRFIFKEFGDKVRLAHTFPTCEPRTNLASIREFCLLYLKGFCTFDNVESRVVNQL